MMRKKSHHSCEVCGRQFNSASKLSRHKLDRHTAHKWSCNICQKTFARKENFLKHVKNPDVHVTCDECGMTEFKSRKELRDHIRSMHGSQARVNFENDHFRNKFSSVKNKFSPVELELLPQEDQSFPGSAVLRGYPLEHRTLVEANWDWMKTKYTRKTATATFSFRFENGILDIEEVGELMRRIHQIQRNSYKMQIQFGYCFRIALSYADPTESQEVSDPMFFIPQKPSASNPGFLPDGPWTVANVDHLEDLISRLDETDIIEHLNLRRPSTKYIVELVSNVMIYLYQLQKPMIGCCQDEALPSYLMKKKSVRTLFFQDGRRTPWGEPKCAFRCLAAQGLTRELGNKWTAKNLKSRSEEMFHQFCLKNSIDPDCFDGAVSLADLDLLEKTFKIRIFVYELVPKGDRELSDCSDSDLAAALLRAPTEQTSRFTHKLYLDLCHNHFSWITKIGAYSAVYICGNAGCKRLFSSRKLCQQHQHCCDPSKWKRKVRCSGGGYNPSSTVFDELETVGVLVPPNLRFMDFFCTYDCETITCPIPEHEQTRGLSTKYEAELILASISVCSSVDGFREPKFLLSDGDSRALVEKCLDYMLQIQIKASRRMQRRFGPFLRSLRSKIADETDEVESRRLLKLQQKLMERINQLHIFGWNSRSFDIPLLRSFLYSELEKRKMKVCKILKKVTAYLLLATDQLKFLDMQALICPHASYSGWLKSLEIPGAAKSFFPFRWFDSLEKLEQKSLPPRSQWTNDLKNQNLSDGEWEEIQRVWTDTNMQTMADFLEFYNNKDVSHFVEGVEKQQMFWRQQGICMITEGVSLSGLSLRLFNKFLPVDSYLALPRKDDYKYIRILRKSVCGGLAQVYRRLHIAGITKIRNGERTVRSIQGWDFNSLYLKELGMEMPISVPFVWEMQGHEFVRKTALPPWVSLAEMEFVAFESWKRKRRIIHYLSAKNQFKIPGSKYRADGFLPPNLVFEFHGCRYHNHQFENPNCPHAALGNTEEEKLQRWIDTNDKIEHIRDRGFRVIEMTSCEWEKKKRSEPEIRQYLYTRFYPPGFSSLPRSMSEQQLLNSIRNGKIFGLCFVDIVTPLSLKPKFEIMQPLVMNRLVSRSDLGEHMDSYCRQFEILKKPRRVLGQAYSARNLLLITPLLQWYMKHGLKVTKLHWVRQFNPRRDFQPIVDTVIHHRKMADRDPALSLQGTSMKLAGNSVYGKMLESGANYTDIKLKNEKELKKCIESPSFRSSEPVTDELYEVESARSQFVEDKPLIIGFFILQYSKMRMLKFVFDFLDRYLDRSQWESVLSDTDSLYVALAGESLDEMIRPELRDAYLKDKARFIACHEDQKRTPGLMKLEWHGTGVIALCPKSYCCFNVHDLSDGKRSHKGVQKAREHSDHARQRKSMLWANFRV